MNPSRTARPEKEDSPRSRCIGGFQGRQRVPQTLNESILAATGAFAVDIGGHGSLD